jgi:hypothetical protein
VAAALVLFSCSSGGSLAEDGGCRASLSESGCPTTWEERAPPACSEEIRRTEGSYQGNDAEYLYTAINFRGLGASLCVYDAGTQRLVGAWLQVDSPSFCNNTSFTRTAGIVPSSLISGSMNLGFPIVCATTDGGLDRD